MTPARYRMLRFLFITIGIGYLVAISLLQFAYYKNFRSERINPVDAPVMWWHDFVLAVLLGLIGIILAFKLTKPGYHLFLAAFLVFFAVSISFYRWEIWLRGESAVLSVVISGFTGALFIYSMMRFAGKRSPDEYGQYFLRRRRWNWYKRAVKFFSQDRPFWLVLFPVLTALMLAGAYVSPDVAFLMDICILVVALIYFRISFYFAGADNRNRLAWLLWGLIATIGLYMVQLFLYVFYREAIYLRVFELFLTSLVICFSFTMAIFFSRSTDARFVVRKTLIYGGILLLGLFLFGAVEHYLIHTIAHALHIQSSILNSLFGAALALAIRPVHHKVEHWLKRLEKKDEKVLVPVNEDPKL